MSTNDHLSFTAAPARLRAQVDRLRRSVMARRPAVRWSLALVVLCGLVSAVYWAATSLNTVGVRFLVAGRRLYSDDLIMVCRALDKQRIDYHVDDHRVTVAADQFDQAAELVAKLDLGQHPIGEIRDESSTLSIFAPPGDREHKKQIAREKIIERLIGQLDGVVWALVSINRPVVSKWGQPSSKPTAFVYIEAEGNRQLPYQTIQRIPEILTGYEPELTPGSITVMDRRRGYLDPGNPGIGVNSRNRAREEELFEEIVEKLDWIKGVRVQVKVTSPQTDPPAVAQFSARPRPGPLAAQDQATANRPGSDVSRSRSGVPSPEMSVNHPIEQEPESGPQPPASATAVTVVATEADANPPGDRRTGPHQRLENRESGRVLVYVPRSFYLKADIRTDSREPSREELRAMEERTKNQIRTAVDLVIPEPTSWKVEVDTIADDVSLDRPVILASPGDARHRGLDWGIVGTVVAVVSILAAVGSWVQLARRPLRLPEPPLKTRHYHADTASEPGPTDRVRELVRRNPAAAASVLQRWTGQGGHIS